MSVDSVLQSCQATMLACPLHLSPPLIYYTHNSYYRHSKKSLFMGVISF
jgi:hypothetical protein